MAAAAAVVALAAVVSVYAQPSISASLSGGTWSVSFSGGAPTYNNLQYSTSGGWTSMTCDLTCNAGQTYTVAAADTTGSFRISYYPYTGPGQRAGQWSPWYGGGPGGSGGFGRPSHPRLAGRLTVPAAPLPVNQVLRYSLEVTNTGRMNLAGVVWRTDPALGITQRPVGEGVLAIGATETVTGSFELADHHLPGPIVVTVYVDSDQTHEVQADSQPVALRAPDPTPTPEPSPAPVGPRPVASTLTVTVVRSMHTAPDAHLAHNIADLNLQTESGETVTCDFWAHYERTGGLERWGHAISEPLEEQPGALTQYYQRGAVDCTPQGGVWSVLRRLAWDYIGGGAYGAPDLGVEPGLLSDQPGTPFGPWGHRVSNLAVDGTWTGFLDFFHWLGGVDAFGYPKTDARRDDDPSAVLGVPGASDAFIRQYFQAAVMEHHPDSPDPVKLRLLGDDLRNILYPDQEYAAFASFNSAEPLTDGQTLALEAVAPN